MTRGTKILLILGGGLIIIFFLIVFIYPLFSRPDELDTITPPPQDVTPEQLAPLPSDQERTTTQTAPIIDPVTNEAAPSEASQRAEVERLSRLFIERFGSYSNFSNFENVTSIQTFMTPSMRAYSETLRGENRSSSGSYYGVTTRVVSLRISEFTAESRATVSAVVIEETQDGLEAPIERRTRDVELDLRYQDGRWLVNGHYYR